MKYDIILWGATSFVGQITARYLLKQYGVDQSISWALGARSKAKLNELILEMQKTNPKANELKLFTADSNNFDSLCQLTSQTKVILSTVGPYYLYGENLIKACLEFGTDYCDLTGEAIFIREMQDKYSKQAEQSGSRIVHCCGCDSIPSDLGVYFTNESALKKHDKPIVAANNYIKSFQGAFSGGTIASLVNILDVNKNNPELAKKVASPYSLCPEDTRDNKTKQEAKHNTYYSKQIKQWVAPFIMASINSKIVHASNAINDYPYSEDFQYNEVKTCSSKFKALSLYYLLGLLMLSLNNKFTRAFVLRFFLPKPGEGPSLLQQEQGHYKYHIYGTTKSGQTVITEVFGDKDPGYGSTGQMFAEAGICLAQDVTKLEFTGGFWTPASILGDKLIARLGHRAGITFKDITNSSASA